MIYFSPEKKTAKYKVDPKGYWETYKVAAEDSHLVLIVSFQSTFIKVKPSKLTL